MRIVTLKDPYAGSITTDIADGLYLGSAITAWTVTVSYAVGDIRYDAATRPNYVYKCKSAVTHTTGTEPNPISDSSRWDLIGTTDRDAEFDTLVNTKSRRVTSHTVTVDASFSNYVTFHVISATNITLTLAVAGVTVKTETFNLRVPVTTADWYSYFDEDATLRNQFKWEYPKYAASTLTVTMTTYVGSMVECGFFRWGISSSQFAKVQKGLSGSLKNYGTKGAVYAVDPGPSADNIRMSFWLLRAEVDNVKALFQRNAGIVALYDLEDDDSPSHLDSHVLLALCDDFTRVFDFKDFAKCSVSLLGVT